MFTWIGEARPSPGASPDDQSNRAERNLIGAIGLALPPLLWLLAGVRPVTVQRWALLPSISSYYHTGGVAAFVGLLVALALFLLSYQGYKVPVWGTVDRVTARVAGGAALVVAFFPTVVPSQAYYTAPWWRGWVGGVHVAAATVLFLAFAVFALLLFTRTDARRQPTVEERRDKRRRNELFFVCGVGIVASIVWAGVNTVLGRSIFWQESAALWCFGISWLVKGGSPQYIWRRLKAVVAPRAADRPEEPVGAASSSTTG